MSLRLTGRRGASIVMGQSLTEGYFPIAQASSPGELSNVTPTVQELSEGRVGRTIVESPIWAPIGPLADLAGAESTFRNIFAPEGIEVLDVHGEGLTTAVIDWRVSPTFRAAQGNASMSAVVILTIAVLGALTLALFATGWAVKQITVLLLGREDSPGGLVNSFGGVVALGAVAVVGLVVLTQSQKRGST